MMEAYAAVGLAYIQLYLGQARRQRPVVPAGRGHRRRRGELNAQLFLCDIAGHRQLREGAAADACEHYAQLEATLHHMGMGEPCLPPWPRHGISAYLAAGRTDAAKQHPGLAGSGR